jgi:hypothetical protein
MNSYELRRPDGTGAGVWGCGACHRVHAGTVGTGTSASDANRDSAEACCVPRTCSFCGRVTERDVLGRYPAVHEACLAAAMAPGPPHPSMENPWARLLYRRMSDISEEGYYAGWLIGNEFSLWRMLEGGGRCYGQCVVSDADLEELRLLSERANGWIWTGGSDEHVPQLVSFARWEELAKQNGA